MEPGLSNEFPLPSRFALQAQLGSGEMGAVYRATDKETGASIAIKVFKTDQQDPLSMARLKRAFHVVSGLNHPNILKMYSIYPDWQVPFFTMELLEGGNFQSLLPTHGNAPSEALIRELLKKLLGILDALQAVHAVGLIHRDLKPANILLDSAGVPKLTDFGLAGMLNPAMSFTRWGAVVGTPPYMSPEQVLGRRVDHRSDLYSFGVILYELLTGSRPFDAESAWNLVVLQAKQSVPPPGEINDAVSPFLEGIVMKLLRSSPAERYENVEQLKRDLISYLDKEEGASSAALSRGLMRCGFLGRDDELAELEGNLEDVCKGSGGVVLIGGEAGVGKTALVEELRARAMLKGVSYFKGRSVLREGVFYRPFASMIRDFDRQTQHNEQEQEQVFGSLGKALARIVPELLGRSYIQQLPDPVPLDEAGEKNRLFDAVTRFVQRIAEQEPVLLLFDDLQWADELTFDLLVYLSRNITGSRVLIAGTYRNEEVIERNAADHPFRAFADTLQKEGLLKEHMTLERFDKNLTEEMVAAMGRGRISGKKAMVAIYNATAGNPYFIEELVQMLARPASIDKPAVKVTDLPQSISELIEGRLKVVDGIGERRVLKAMAIFGKAVSHDVLLTLLTPMDSDLLLDILEHLMKHRILVELGSDLYQFAHPLMGEVLCNGMTNLEKASLHEKTARALEEISRNQAGAWSRELIYHWEQAGNQSRALTHSLNAGLHAAAVYASVDAVSYLGHVVDHFEESGLSPERLLQCLSVLVGTAIQSQEFSAYEKYMSLYEQKALEMRNAEEHARAALMTADGLAVRGRLTEATAKFQSVLRMYSGEKFGKEAQRRYAYHLTQRLGRPMQALAILEPLSRKTEGSLRVDCLLDLMRTYWKLGRLEEARQIATSLENDASLETDQFQMSRFLNVAGIIVSESGVLEEAKGYFEKKIAIDTQANNLYGLSRAIYNLAEILHEQGHWNEAMEKYNASLAGSRKLGNVGSVALVKENLSWLSLEMGQLANAKLLAREVHDLIRAQASNDPELITRSAIRRAHLARWDGKLDFARIILQKALQEVEQKGQHGYFTSVITPLAEIFLETGKMRQASDLLESCRALETRSGRHYCLAEVNARLAECKIRRNDPEARKEMIREAGTLEELGYLYRSAVVLKRTAKALIDTGHPDLAQKAFLSAHKLFSELGAKQDIKDLNEWGSLAVPQSVASDPAKEMLQRLALPPFVGREQELSEVSQYVISRLKDRKGALCLIEGESGLGKTRFVFETVSNVEILPAAPRVALLMCRKLHQRPLAPFETAVNTLLSHVDGSLLTPLMPVLAALFPSLRTRMEFQMVRPAPPLEPPLQKERAMDVLLRFFQAACDPDGLVMVVDDLGLADRITLDTIKLIFRNSTRLPVVILASATGTVSETLFPSDQAPGGIRIMRFSPLSRTAVNTILQEVLEPGPSVKELSDYFFQGTEGNPLFLKELLEYMVRGHFIKKAGGSVSIKPDAQIPRTFKDIVLARAGSLSPEALRVLHVAAVLGREFDFDIVERILEMEEEALLTHLEELEKNHVIVSLDYDPLGRALYRFHHPQIKEIVWQEMAPVSRITLHRKAGEVLEMYGVGGQEINPADLAHHYEKGGDQERALRYGLQAAHQAQEMGDQEEAERFYLAVERLSPALPDAQQGLAEIAMAHHRWEELAVRLNRMGVDTSGPDSALLHQLKSQIIAHESGGAEALQYLRLLPAQTWPAREAMSYYAYLGEQLRKAGDYSASMTACEKGLALEPGAPDPDRAAELRAIYAWCLTEEGRPDAALLLLQGDLAALDNLSCRVQIRTLRAGQHAHQSAGRMPEAIKLQQELCRRLEEAQDTVSLATQRANLAMLYSSYGDLESAAESARMAHETAERLDLSIRKTTADLVAALSRETEEKQSAKEKQHD
jgi:predicted ATPase